MVSAAVSLDAVRAAVESVPDPELPHVTIGDLGMVRGVHVEADTVVVTVTPTYTACPATEAICADIVAATGALGVADVRVRVDLAPAWAQRRNAYCRRQQ